MCGAGGTLLGADVLAGVHKTRVKGHGEYDGQTCSGSKSTGGEMAVFLLQAGSAALFLPSHDGRRPPHPQ